MRYESDVIYLPFTSTSGDGGSVGVRHTNKSLVGINQSFHYVKSRLYLCLYVCLLDVDVLLSGWGCQSLVRPSCWRFCGLRKLVLPLDRPLLICPGLHLRPQPLHALRLLRRGFHGSVNWPEPLIRQKYDYKIWILWEWIPLSMLLQIWSWITKSLLPVSTHGR